MWDGNFPLGQYVYPASALFAVVDCFHIYFYKPVLFFFLPKLI